MILVTGGAGFVGSNLVRALNRRGVDDILIVDSLQRGEKHLNLNRLKFRDFIDYEEFPAALERLRGHRVEAIFHQGACTDTMEYDGRKMMRKNFHASCALLDFAQAVGARLVYASSAAVYGNGDHGFREEPACEYPLNVYGYSKLLFDQVVRQRHRPGAPQVVGLRYFNVYGPQENHKGRMASVIFQFHQQVQQHGEIRPFEGSDRFRRDFIHVDDLVRVNLFFFDHPQTSGIFNCGTGQAESFQRIAEIMQTCYAGCGIHPVPFPESLQGKYQAYTQADLTQLRAAGYEAPFTRLDDGVRAYVERLKTTGGYYSEPLA